MFEQRDGALYFSRCGERVCIQALGRDGLRVRATMEPRLSEDEACWNCADQYMFGARYLVAPVLYEGMRARSVYLPAGRWKNIHTGEELAGGCTVTAEAPLDVIPVFEKLG